MVCSLLHYLMRPLEIGSARRTLSKDEDEEARGDFLFVTSSLLRLRNINLGKQGKGGRKVARKGHAQRIALPLLPYLPGDVVGLYIRHSGLAFNLIVNDSRLLKAHVPTSKICLLLLLNILQIYYRFTSATIYDRAECRS